MDDEPKAPTAEELAAEDIAIKESKEEDIRSSVLEKYELAEDTDSELIDKLTKDIISQQKSFGKVVSQKRSWRDKALNPTKKEETKVGDKNLTADEIKKQASNEIEEKFMKRDLEEIDVSDTLKEEIKKLAKLKDLSIRQAFKDPYIVYLKSEEDAEKKLDKATIKTVKNGKTVAIDSDTKLDPNDFEMSTAEGRKAWDAAKATKKR